MTATISIEQILKDSEREVQFHQALEKAAAEIEAEHPELEGDVIRLLNEMTDEDLDKILESASTPDEGVQEDETAVSGEEQTTEDTSEGREQGGEAAEAEQKAAEEGEVSQEQLEMIDKVAEYDALAEYVGARIWDSFSKSAAEYGIVFQDPNVVAFEEVAEAVGQKIAEQVVGQVKQAETADSQVEDEKLAQELYDLGRLACVGRFYLDGMAAQDEGTSQE